MLHIKLWLVDEYYYRFCTNSESYDHDQKAKRNIIEIELGENLLMSILEIKDVTYGYTKLEHILFEVNQNFECGKFYAIIGK